MAYFEKTNLADSKGEIIDPASSSLDDQVVLLRRIVKLLESQAAVDTAQRQRVTLDAITAGTVLPTVTTVTTVATVTTVTGVTNVTNLGTLAGYDQRLYSDWARQAYNTGIRSALTFS